MAVKHCNVGKSLVHVFQEGVAPICMDPLVWQLRPVTKLPRGHKYLYCQSSDHLGNAVKLQFRRCISSVQSNSKAFCSAVNTGSAIDVTAVNLHVTNLIQFRYTSVKRMVHVCDCKKANSCTAVVQVYYHLLLSS